MKEVKTLQNPEVLQNLGQPTREAKSFRQGKSQFGSGNAPTNRVSQNNFKRDGGSEVANQNTQFTFSTTEAPFNNRRTPEDLSSLPIAGSVLPGGLRNFQFSQTTQRGSPFNNPSVSSTSTPFQANAFRAQSTSPASFSRQNVNPVSFTSPSSTPNSFNRGNSFGSTISPVSFTQKFSLDSFNRLQPSGFQKPTTTSAFTQRVSTPTPNFASSAATESPEQEEFVGGGLPEIDNIIKAEIEQPLNGQLPNDRFNTFIKRFNPNEEPPRPTTQAPTTRFAPQVSTTKRNFNPAQQDLTVASQENLVSGRRSTPSAPEEEEEEFVGGGLPHIDNIIKADIDQPVNGTLPLDKFNSFIKRFNPFDEPPKPTTEAANSEEPQEVQSFINRFIPEDSPLVTGYNLEEQPGEPQFINRFVLTPEELMQDKNKHDIERLHSLQPPEAQLTVNFPNFELSPPLDDSDDSESNQIQLHLQDPRTAFFIPSGDAGSGFSKADAAPIVVTIPLHSNQHNIPMLFRKETSEEPCARCHPSFIVNKQNCVPCVVIR